MIHGRGSGILLHISSLPSPFGIGDVGEGAYAFVDFLSASGQGYWQILPINPTLARCNHSPYMNPSAFAGQPLFISPDHLIKEGLLRESDLGNAPRFSRKIVDYREVIPFKKKILTITWKRFTNRSRLKKADSWLAFCRENSFWLDDFALFMALKGRYRGATWDKWPVGIRDRRAEDLRSAARELAEETEREKFFQFLFFSQWETLKQYCQGRKIFIIGDMPIYVGHDSVDVWSQQNLFKLDNEKRPAAVSGVPPDAFDRSGQFWGHPVYRWNVLRKTGYEWLIRRITHNCKLFDFLRIDHFRGFVNYWEIPAWATKASRGQWVTAPADDFFRRLAARLPSLPLICEDLGASPPEFRDVMERFGFPGMRVLLFAFGSDFPNSPHAPHHYLANCAVYTGTHDTDTIHGWIIKEATRRGRQRLARYVGKRLSRETVHWDVIRLALMSVAGIAVIPMQDILGLGEDARMNIPGTREGNWLWRLPAGYSTPALANRLREMTALYGRCSGEKKDAEKLREKPLNHRREP